MINFNLIEFNYVLGKITLSNSEQYLCQTQTPIETKNQIKLNQTIQRLNGPNIGFSFGNFMELKFLNVFTEFCISNHALYLLINFDCSFF